MEEVDVSEDHILAMADFVEQESSSLKLLLGAMCKNYASMTVDPHGNILSIRKGVDWHDFPVELDSSGIPVLTPEIIEALKNAAIF